MQGRRLEAILSDIYQVLRCKWFDSIHLLHSLRLFPPRLSSAWTQAVPAADFCNPCEFSTRSTALSCGECFDSPLPSDTMSRSLNTDAESCSYSNNGQAHDRAAKSSNASTDTNADQSDGLRVATFAVGRTAKASTTKAVALSDEGEAGAPAKPPGTLQPLSVRDKVQLFEASHPQTVVALLVGRNWPCLDLSIVRLSVLIFAYKVSSKSLVSLRREARLESTMDSHYLGPASAMDLTPHKKEAVRLAKAQEKIVYDRCQRSNIPVPEYAFDELIGKGSFGRVYKGSVSTALLETGSY